MKTLSRRELLLGSAGIGAFATALALGGRAFAMSEEKLRGDSELGLAYANRCSALDGGAHAQIMGDLQAMLLKQPGQKGQVLTQTAICPICGCPVTASRTVG
jgi:hypothetical protein